MDWWVDWIMFDLKEKSHPEPAEGSGRVSKA